VAIAPIRYGAGVKLKTIEALQYGIPTVATTVGAEGIDTFDTGALVVADDPSGFAQAIVNLVDDSDRWNAQRRAIAELHGYWEAAEAGTSWLAVVDAALRDRVLHLPERVGTDS
jgi:glycosyltransferase involved in cell wall biosynthesis